MAHCFYRRATDSGMPQSKRGLFVGFVMLMSAAQNLLTFLKSIAGNRVVSGQFIETGPGMTAIDAIQAATGQWLGLIGGDFWHYGGTGAPVAGYPFNAAAIPYWQ